MKPHIYFVYITTNPKKTVYYTGVTNNVIERLQQHFESRGKGDHFASKYFCYNLLYYEEYNSVNDAIKREKEIKGWRRSKKDALISSINPTHKFLNEFVILGGKDQ